jgi:RNA polymerase sigma-70 factor (ECF subfamily)
VQAVEESQLVAALRAGDEAAFMHLVELYGRRCWRLARMFVRSERSPRRSCRRHGSACCAGSIASRALEPAHVDLSDRPRTRRKTRGERERRSVPFSALAGEEHGGPAVAPERFQGQDERFPGGWASFPGPWDEVPEQRLLSQETRRVVDRAIAALPDGQRAVITMRDVVGCSSEEVCNVLGAFGDQSARAPSPRPEQGPRRARGTT